MTVSPQRATTGESDGFAERARDLGRSGAIALAGFAFVGLLVPDARVGAGLAASVFVAGSALVLLRGRSPSQRRVSSPSVPPVREVLGAAVEAMPEPAFLVDRDLCFQAGNAAALKTFGPIEEGDPIALRFRAPDVLAAAEEAISSGERREADYVERAPDDRSFGLDLLPVSVGDARPSYLVIRFLDRTAERRIERMRIDFVANASHELRTPLASLIGFIETLQGPARDDKNAQKQFLEIMRQQAARMSRLIDDLLSLSRIETKRRLSSDDRADLVAVVNAVMAEMQGLAVEVGVELEADLGGAEQVEVTGDRDELTRVFANLVENACRYASQGRRVIVGLRPDADGVEAFVRDFGPGIEERHIPRLTERFYRAKADAFPSGTGLGLSIVRNILLRHGTRLVIRSREGEGSTFSVRFRKRADAGS